ncbi:hypothetical protein EBR57_03845 [bacterium]|nr:hypothetical protein [bacterium]
MLKLHLSSRYLIGILVLTITMGWPAISFAGYQDALDFYYLGQYQNAKRELERVDHPNRALLLSLIQLRTHDVQSRQTFESATVPPIGTFDRVLRLWFSSTENVTEFAASTKALEKTDKQAFIEPANLELAKTYFDAKQYKEAKAAAAKLAGAKRSDIRKDALMIEVRIAMIQKKQSEAEALYRRFLTDFPTSDKEYRTLIALNEQFGTTYGVLDILQTRKNQMEFIRGLYSRKAYYDYRVMADEYLRRRPSSDEIEELQNGLAVVAFESGDYTKSVALTEAFIEKHPRSRHAATAQYYLARGLHRLKKYKEAKSEYITALEQYPGAEYGPATYYYLYWVCQELGASEEYEPYLRQFKSKYSNTLFYDKLMWEFGWNAYLKQDYSTAFNILNKADWKFDLDVMSKVSFWVAKAMAQIDPGKAQPLFKKVVEDHPFTYYGYRVATQLFPDTIGSISGRFKSTGLQIDPLYRTMLEAGLGDMAVADLDYRVTRMKDHNSKTIVTMAYLYSGMLQNHRAINLLTSLGFAINPKEPKISKEIAQLLYPRPYWDTILKYSTEYQVDPYLVVALMREESLFNAQARSRTGALGLMQIMPTTGQGIAKGLRINWEGPEMLLVPQTNIRFGVCYIASLKKRFNNNPILMLSGYNAGPNATRKWLDNSPADVDMDIFVANIPYSETHYYVTRVLKSYWIYRLLYDPEFKDKLPKKEE